MNAWLPRSFLFEIIDIQTNQILQSFTLVLPPQQLSIREKQRVSLTKTYDRTFVDDYGPDNLEITIRGMSGTAHAFPTFQTSGITNASLPKQVTSAPEVGYRDVDAFLAFRNSIIRYKQGSDFSNKRLRVYDLFQAEAYECVLLDFTLDRSSDNPYRYPFTISLIVLTDLLAPRAPNQESLFTPITTSSYLSMIQAITTAFVWVNALRGVASTLQTYTNLITGTLDTVVGQISSAGDAILSLASFPTSAVSQLVDAFADMNAAAYNLYKNAGITIEQYVQIADTTAAGISSNLRLWSASVQASANKSQQIAGIATKNLSLAPSSAAAEPGSGQSMVSTQQDVLTCAGFRQIVIGGADTLRSIAQRELHDPSLWPYIASINGLTQGDSSLVSGMALTIPSLSFGLSNPNVLKYTAESDPLGSDIRIDANGNHIVEGGDFTTIGSVAAMAQAINNRLSTQQGAIILHNAYGLLIHVGQAASAAAETYVKMAITATLLDDPRVFSVDSVLLSGGGNGSSIVASLIVSLRDVDRKLSTVVPLGKAAS